MKLIFRIIGLVVVLAVLAAALLYFLNEKNILKGPVSDWINNVKENIFNIKDDTEEMINQMKDSDDPIGDSLNVPGKSRDSGEEADDQPAGDVAGQETPIPTDLP
jgi:hypothetical protein